MRHRATARNTRAHSCRGTGQGCATGESGRADSRDRALAFDYNGNGPRDNLVLYRPGAGVIWILNSLNN